MSTIRSYWLLAKILACESVVETFLVLLSIPLFKKAFGRRPRHMRLCYKGTTFHFYARDGADVAVLREMFIEREYDVALRDPSFIVDIGSHIGGSVVFLKLKYPDARIRAYEPEPSNFALLLKNTKGLKGVECVNAAVSVQTGTATLSSRSGSSISGSIKRFGSGVEVKTVAIDEILDSYIDLLKFDVEGAEYDIFSAATKLGMVKMLVGELHLDLLSGKTKEQFCSIFKEFTVSEHKLNDRRYIITAQRK